MKRKLIEVALPLEAINKESAREKSIRHGHPSTLHLWWSRKPLATCRAVLFASLVDDPSSLPDQFPTEADQDKERQRLFRLIEDLVKWDNSNNQTILNAAHDEILKSTDGHPPPIYDPFCGGGSIPLEAQRLGLEAHGSDLNPVAVLITKALIEIPPKFAGQPPVNPGAKAKMSGKGMWTGARGLGSDVRFYGKWMRERALEEIGRFYPDFIEQQDRAGHSAPPIPIIAWLYYRTVQCPNPACKMPMPLASKFWLSTKPGKQAWVEPLINYHSKSVTFIVREGAASPEQSKMISIGSCLADDKGKKAKAAFRCVSCQTGIAKGEYIDVEANEGRMSYLPVAIVVDSGGRGYRSFDSPTQLSPIDQAREVIQQSELSNLVPNEPARGTFASNAQGRIYGFTSFGKYFLPRQTLALVTYTRLIREAHTAMLKDGATPLYAAAVSTYLAMGISRLTDICNALCRWEPSKTQVRNLFTRQAIPMLWDLAEPNVFASAAGDFETSIENLAKALDATPARCAGTAEQRDATSLNNNAVGVVSTDPPYYDNVSYADLSDFFYVWLRRALGSTYPDLFSTLLVPKKMELAVTLHRFAGDKNAARDAFVARLGEAFTRMKDIQDPHYPLTVYYAFKQSESDEEDDGENVLSVASTGWETMLEGLLGAEFEVTATWPMRSELATRPTASGANALASSIVLACRVRPEAAGITTRKDFLASLKKELPRALRNMQKGNIAPVDLAQAAIGPGMAVFSRYKRVLETDGSPMRIRTALALINQGLDEVLSELESEFDADTRWALAWFEQHQFEDGHYGEAEVLATAKALSISHLAEAGILNSRAGRVRLLRREELPADWNPTAVDRLTVWEVTQHLIRSLDQKGEKETANLKAKIGGLAEIARDLAYRLYTLCERKGWAEEAGYYNSLVVAWPSMASEVFELK